MKEIKKSIPIIKLLIIFSLLIFIISLVYINLFKTDQTITLRQGVTANKELKKKRTIKAFVDYVDQQPNVTFNRKSLSVALFKLKKAIDAIALSTGYEFQYADLIIAEYDIERISREKLFSTQSYYLKKVTMILSNSLRKIQRQKYPDLEKQADTLKAASERFNGTDLKLDQDQKIKVFLSKATDLVNGMR
ncbi:hypothetical protein [Pedobacter sp. V48]|uniref:hypothetical protein n=1 Tax=Pedobacter sp. V48 TaxID=509635 RepID=UPI0003E5771C|nr:hypothetical protein [Pedobacter sp. V48]ETZ19572.1 hypothetical protein N824_12585 [Pedobacter sp. V48]